MQHVIYQSQIVTEMVEKVETERHDEVSLRKFEDIEGINHGLVLMGADGEGIANWVIDTLENENISRGFKDFEQPFKVVTTGGRVDIVLPFADGHKINISRLAIWRLQMGDASWVSDYVVNYADQH